MRSERQEGSRQGRRRDADGTRSQEYATGKMGAPVTDEVHPGQVSGTSAPQPGGASQMKGPGAASLHPSASSTLQSTVALVAL